MAFPTEFPQTALQEFVGLFGGGDKNAGRIALAAYDLVGYGLFSAFGDVKYLMSADPALLAKIAALLQGVDLNTVKNLPLMSIIDDVTTAIQKGTPYWQIALQVTFKYGPQVIGVISAIQSILALLGA